MVRYGTTLTQLRVVKQLTFHRSLICNQIWHVVPTCFHI